MQILKLDPRALKDNPDDTRRSKSSPQSDALLLATVKAVGIIQPPVISPEIDGGNGYIIQAGHRRVKQAIAAGMEEITVLVVEAANDNGAMRSMVENIAREPLNPVDQWRGIERLVALGWTEEAIGVALALPVRQIRKLRLLANVLPPMLDHMALGDMPNEQQLRTIAAASLDEQKEVWKANKPKKSERADWYNISRALSKTRMFAKDASFGDDLAAAYGIEWVEDLFAPADQDSRYTTNVEAFLGAQQEWMTSNLPKKGAIIEVNNWGQPELPKKAERVYGKPSKSDHVGMYLDRDGKVQSVAYRVPEEKKKGKGGAATVGGLPETDDTVVDAPKSRPEVTQKGQDMIGDFRTDALHEALGRAPIEDDMLMALLVLAFAGLNVRVDSGASDTVFGPKRFKRHAARLIGEDGRLAFDGETLRVAARSMLIDVLSCRRGMSNSGVISRIAGDAIGADNFLPNMGSEDFLLCLSRQAMEAAAKEANVLPRQKVRETRAALVDHFRQERFVHTAALFAPDPQDIVDLIKSGEVLDGDTKGHDGRDDNSAEEEDVDGSALGEEEGLATPEDEADLPDSADDAPEAVDPDQEQDAYGIAAE
ncbi:MULTISPECIES: ParB N-terminal domain-containing protein [Rhizobium/Agrobacterium group]|uniref:Plasmid partitioning protein n=1 Tax=Rhizobium rhizogenes TaxID=359 RepID=A0A2Z2PFJ6_RHIRH|nr:MULTISPECIES: ParB N-terminal domain-containing protein [Rhizobium/Agrobacterium group]ASK41060.1 plasmid partitioning protein [Rhizobium rhizogenes]NTI46407.1 ParB N-terminal domain-containing protein [Rhizobium rhizogenes]UXR95219.1 ParB N-terminal domain-containing protein [Agrobacterium tumefaciens]UXS28014.1 ParB N-terminal domain-containing protein [Agrobacterium tumefaciens]UXS35588.1 ParB N-terminal domain-containing protein [Agrobacterium tumefaciens]